MRELLQLKNISEVIEATAREVKSDERNSTAPNGDCLI